MPLVKYGGVLMKIRSSARRPRVSATWPALLETARSVWQTPLGTPVVPDVNMIIAGSSSRTGSNAPMSTSGMATGSPAGQVTPPAAEVPAASRRPLTRPSASAVTTRRRGPSEGQAPTVGSTSTSGAALSISHLASTAGKLVLSGTITAPASQAPSMQTKNWSYSSR